MKDQLTKSASAIATQGCCSWSLVAASAAAIPPATSAAGPKKSHGRRFSRVTL
jgi:hypothetical protein